ncbi:MAG: PilZ domain-containing protein [Candidatus Omnitrophica bacterium]|nr:PilZ domain-containing protein [Candidatus Omnitrophota bacterium]
MKRKAERKDFSGEAKICLLGEDIEFSATIQDISLSGIRIIVTGRIVKANTLIEIKMCVDGRPIQCNGRVAWTLPLRPGFGDIILFDAGIELINVIPEDSEFLKKFCGS